MTWNSDARELRIGSGPASYVEIHENFNPGWTAELNGRPLQPATLDGWQQAFIVPAGRGGTITLRFRPASLYHAVLIGSGILLLILAGVALGVRRPRRRRPSTAEAGQPYSGPADTSHEQSRSLTRLHISSRPLFRKLLTLAPLTAVLVVAGGPIAAAVPVLAVIDIWLPRWRQFIAFGAMFAAGVVAATASNPTVMGSGPFSGPAQIFALLALAAALLPATDSR